MLKDIKAATLTSCTSKAIIFYPIIVVLNPIIVCNYNIFYISIQKQCEDLQMLYPHTPTASPMSSLLLILRSSVFVKLGLF